MYPDAGHGSHFQYPELFLHHTRIFLDDQFDPDSPHGPAPRAAKERGGSMKLGLAREKLATGLTARLS